MPPPTMSYRSEADCSQMSSHRARPWREKDSLGFSIASRPVSRSASITPVHVEPWSRRVLDLTVTDRREVAIEAHFQLPVICAAGYRLT